VVSPVLAWEDLPGLQQVVRAVRGAGARVDPTCGIHIHVDGARFDAKAVRNLVKLVNKQEALIEHALGVRPERRQRWARGIDQDFLARLERERPTLAQLNRLWYGFENRQPHHYDSSRYHGVNLHNIWFGGTIEFRWFDSTLHAGKIKAYIQFILALAARAIAARATSSRKRELDPATAKYDFRVFLLRLGLVGDEFKTARLHLLERLGGSAAWKHGRPPVAPTAQPQAVAH
jgi:hypothetical protein